MKKLWNTLQDIPAMRIVTHMLDVAFLRSTLRLYASALTYSTLLALAPLLAFVLAVLQAFGVPGRLEPILAEMLAPLGDRAQLILEGLNHVVTRIQVGVLGGVGFAMFLATAISLLERMDDIMQEVWQAPKRPPTRRWLSYITLLVLAPLGFLVVLAIPGSLLTNALVRQLLPQQALGFMETLSGLAPLAVVWIFLALAYQGFPNIPVRFWVAWGSALVTTVLWHGLGLFFARMIASSGRYDAVYSGFAGLVLALLWVQMSWLVFLSGVELCAVLQYPHRLHHRQNPASTTSLSALVILYLCARAFHRGDSPPDLASLIRETAAEATHVEYVLQELERQGLVGRCATTPQRFTLLKDPATIPIAPYLIPDGASRPALLPTQLAMVLQQAQLLIQEHFSATTLADLLEEIKPQGGAA
jgi:membrane protein